MAPRGFFRPRVNFYKLSPSSSSSHFVSSCCWFLAGYWEEEHSYSQRSWQRYQREVLQELSCRGEEEDEDDEEGNKYDSD